MKQGECHMIIFTLLFLFLIFLYIGIPIGFSMLFSSIFYIIINGTPSLIFVVQRLISSLNSFIPL